jgi:hypothetical protein
MFLENTYWPQIGEGVSQAVMLWSPIAIDTFTYSHFMRKLFRISSQSAFMWTVDVTGRKHWEMSTKFWSGRSHNSNIIIDFCLKYLLYRFQYCDFYIQIRGMCITAREVHIYISPEFMSSANSITLQKAFSFSKEKLWKNHGKRPCFSFVFLWKDQWQNKGFFLCVFPAGKTEDKTQKETKSFTKKPLCISTFDQRQFPLCFTSWKDTKEKPFVCHWCFQGKTKEKQGLFLWFFYSFSLKKLNAFYSVMRVYI